MTPPRTRRFDVGDHRLAYDVRGDGPDTVVLIPGLLMSRRMQGPLADELAATGLRVVTLDPLGTGESDRPADSSSYSMRGFAEQVVALLDELGVDRAVVYGTSAGSAMTLAVAAHAPDRLHGIVVEGPVLDRSILFATACAGVVLAGLTYGRPLAWLTARGAAALPRGFGLITDLTLDWLAQDARPSAAAMQGMIYTGFKPPKDVREQLRPPVLVIGYRYFDPIHRPADARGLVEEAPDARLLRARTWLELRSEPARLAPEIAGFVRACHAAGATANVVTA
ncbi:alpha/beta fold hydrolase [Nocardia sp. CDC160]|uniref:alpha/beta fold hydrolase n=1 Tax=Nocardia sp. CDC160 TaxID=3112166 RepID=UPI002DBA68C9|nr:alpha/beta hydrolase [Nocardia sp. CDC160]MEC3919366.1 alpha/beta hydrolase [Nocardia sp. CDC160]